MHPIDTPLNRPVEFFFRLVLVSAALLWLAMESSAGIITWLLPEIRAEVTAIDGNMTILSLELAHEGSRDTVRMRANLRYPSYYHDSPIYPLGWTPGTQGWYQVDLNASAALQSLLTMLIAILSWPHRTIREFVTRLLIAVPLVAILFALDTPLDLLGNFQEAVIHHVDPRGHSLLFDWGRLLEGGGSTALALTLAAVAISLGAQAGARQSAQESRPNSAI